MDVRTALVVLVSLTLARDPDPRPLANDGVHKVGDYGNVILLKDPPNRRLRGDWEPPDLLVIAYSEEWAASAATIIRAAGDQTEVAIVTRAGDSISYLAEWLAAEELLSPHIRFIDARLDSPWVRDFGPFEVVGLDGERTWLDALYDTARPLDDALPEVLGENQRVRVEQLPFSIDGGALVSNGAGVCAVTGGSLEAAGIDIEDGGAVASLQKTLGCHALAVVPALVGERTGHADISIQFMSTSLVAVARIAPSQSPLNAILLDEAARTIRRAGKLIGQDLDVVRVHMPVSADGETFYTYVNGLRLHAGFVVPSYAAVSAVDEQSALADLDSALREVPLLAAPADQMILLSGAIHCVALGLAGGVRAFEEEGAHALR